MEAEVISLADFAQTTDYNLFQSIASNRELNEAHVLNLMKSISEENLLHVNPIVVNGHYEVIDGQHRLEAATRLGIPIYYIRSETVTKRNIASLNSIAKKWLPVDYINYWKMEGVAEYSTLSRFLNAHPKIQVSSALNLLHPEGARDMEAFRAGRIQVGNYAQALQIATILEDFAGLCDFAYSHGFIVAMSQLFRTGLYDHKLMLTKLEYQRRNLVKCVGVKQYVEMLSEIYNYKTREENRVKFS